MLPRFLRRPARLFGRMIDGRFRSAALFGLDPHGGLSSSPAPLRRLARRPVSPSIVQAVTSPLGFAIDEVKISGHHETSEIDILERLGLDGWTSTIGFDAEAARERIAALPWVEVAAVRKIYPDTLEVRIEERKPFAIWQHGSELSLIERDGHVIAPYTRRPHAMLPLVIGLGAPEAAPAFIDQDHAAIPSFGSRVKGYIRVAERRWDVRLENGITVKLPEADEDQALDQLAAIDRDAGLLSRDIAAVDMRFADRLVVQLTPEAADAPRSCREASA